MYANRSAMEIPLLRVPVNSVCQGKDEDAGGLKTKALAGAEESKERLGKDV